MENGWRASRVRWIPRPPTLAQELPRSRLWKVICASAAGTVIEWYDFHIFGSLATTISPPASGNIYAGLYHPIVTSVVTLAVGSLLLREIRHVRIWHEVAQPHEG